MKDINFVIAMQIGGSQDSTIPLKVRLNPSLFIVSAPTTTYIVSIGRRNHNYYIVICVHRNVFQRNIKNCDN